MNERACCAEARERLLPQFWFDCTTCGHATNCAEHWEHVRISPGAIPLEAMLEERTRQAREAESTTYETARALAIEASRRMLEMERRRDRRDRWVMGVLVALWVATAVAMLLKATGVLP